MVAQIEQLGWRERVGPHTHLWTGRTREGSEGGGGGGGGYIAMHNHCLSQIYHHWARSRKYNSQR